MTGPNHNWPRMTVGAVTVDLLSYQQAMELIFESLTMSSPLAVVSANLQHISEFADRSDWAARTPTADDPANGLRWLTLLDGVPLARRAETLTGRKWPKLAGSEMLAPILEQAAAIGVRVGFLGGSIEAQSQLSSILETRFPSLRVVGAWTPNRSELEDPDKSAAIARQVRAAQADLLIVGLGKPRQEDWIALHGLSTSARIFLAFGAASDFLAGRVRRSPRPLAAVGLEWAWRLMLEPRRLWRRYLVDGPPAWVRLRFSARLNP